MLPMTAPATTESATPAPIPTPTSGTFAGIRSAVPFTRVRVDDAFWSPRMRVNREQAIPANLAQCRETGRIAAFSMVWKQGMPNQPHEFWDSDVAKFIEAASYSLATHPDAALERELDGIISAIAAAQQPDGYLNTYFQLVRPGSRWSNLRDSHELYCAGHLVEAAVAHHAATGKRTLLDVMCRYADHIARTFGTGAGQLRGYCGHPEIELALMRLWRATGESRYLELSRYFVDERGQQPSYFAAEALRRNEDPAKNWAPPSYYQAHQPVREQSQATGHAVRAMYLYAAMADQALACADASLRVACEQLWEHATTRLMYVTGGFGSSRHNEGFTADYDLPNESAYCETCAAIAFVFFSSRMLALDGDGRYADAIERSLYNNVLAGVSLDGTKFFYENPLASRGAHRRKPWFGCACCPPNVARLMASLGGYAYGEGAEAMVHLYVQGEATLRIAAHDECGRAAARDVVIRQRTDFPWSGTVDIEVLPSATATFVLKLRKPSWAPRMTVTVNGTAHDPRVERGYAAIEREWRAGDTVRVDLEMPVTRVRAHPRVSADEGRVALTRGPLVYCLEGVDNGADLDGLRLPPSSTLTPRRAHELFDGVTVIEGSALRAVEDGDPALYRVSAEPAAVPVPRFVEQAFTAIPYFAWENREPGDMQVWVREAAQP